MSSRLKSLCLILCLSVLAVPDHVSADLATLFTTPQERQLINANRYKTDEPKAKPKPAAQPEIEIESPVQILLQEEVVVDYRISGISLSPDGMHTAWINGQAYLDGQQLEDESEIKVIAGEDIKVRITAPDGRHYYATSGESVSVSYMATVEN